MNDVLYVILVGLVIFGVMFALRSRDTSRQVSPAPPVSPAAHLASHPVDPMVVSTVLALLGQRKKIQAVKELRDATGLGLADAKALVEAIEAGHRPPAVVLRGEAVDVTPAAPRPQPETTRSDLAVRALALRSQGREVDAIRLVCDETGMGILDAQKFVRALS
ncbi:ribosomal protein L7/L12 [Actinopolymorpha alba]|uniref:ribosomal protein L7/L12 n=1 Tax=Actinopolymorpha alba TaxID=533267 RepID=UPI0003A3E82C|nr:ribosomal protein L7/L12 [Actinopolymorpha alba]